MTILNVSTKAQLDAALKTAVGGDKIVLADGDYGDLALTTKFDAPVSIVSKNPLGANFTSVALTGAGNLSFDGIDVAHGFAATQFATNIKLSNSSISDILYMKNVNGLVIDNNNVNGKLHASLFNNVQNFVIKNNTIHDSQEDLMRVTGNSYNGTIENNTLRDMHPEDHRATGGGYNHADAIQMFGVDGTTPHDIVIRGNYIYDDPETGASTTTPQGIFLSDPSAGSGGYRNILIEDNLISVRSTNSIYINGGQENVVIRGNTLIPNDGDGGAIIRLANKAGYDNSGTTVEGNIAKLLYDETGHSTIGNNYFYGRGADLSALFSGNGSQWEHFVPVAGSPISLGYGAAHRISELVKSYLQPAALPAAAQVEEAAHNVYAHHGDTEFNGKISSAVIEHHNDALAIDEGTISFAFQADTVGWRRGLISKDSKENGDHFSAWVQDGSLMVSFQDGAKETVFTHKGITAHTEYNFHATFGDHMVRVYLDGHMIGEAKFDMDLSTNAEYLVIGGNGQKSDAGTTSYLRYAFDGTISDVNIYDKSMTPAALESFQKAMALSAQQQVDHHAADLSFNAVSDNDGALYHAAYADDVQAVAGHQIANYFAPMIS